MNEVLIVVKSRDDSSGGLRKARGEVEHLHSSVGKASIGFRAFGGFFRSAVSGIVAAGVVGFAAVTAEVFRATKGWADHEAIARDTESTIKSTGGAAKVTAVEVGRLADAIEMKTTKDGDAIQSGANMLLTFKDIRNETGKGNDIFNQSVSILTDMTAKMNQGSVTNENMSKSAIQLGKALNDPIAGMGALAKVGVQFTDAQKEQIKALVESGDKMGAQKIILHELATEFQGAAKASAKPWDGVVVVLRKVEDAIGSFLLPKVQALSNWVLNTGLPALARLKTEWDHNHGAIKTVADILKNQFTPAGGGAKKTVDNLGSSLHNVEIFLDKAIIVALRTEIAWLHLAIASGTLSKWILNVGISLLMTYNALRKLSFGVLPSADAMIAGMRHMRDGTEAQLDRIRGDIHKAQATIDSLHGRAIELTLHDQVTARLRQIKAELASTPGMSVTARLTRGGTYQHGTMFVPQTGPAYLHRGEIVVPPDESEQIRRGKKSFGHASSGTMQVVVNAVTNANPHEIGREVA